MDKIIECGKCADFCDYYYFYCISVSCNHHRLWSWLSDNSRAVSIVGWFFGLNLLASEIWHKGATPFASEIWWQTKKR